MGPRTHLAARAGGQGDVGVARGAARWGDRSVLDANPRKPPRLIYSVIDYTIHRGDVRRRGVSIVEIGVSTGNSTIALLAGILQLRRLGWDGELLRDGRH
jgi:hypothetical protein